MSSVFEHGFCKTRMSDCSYNISYLDGLEVVHGRAAAGRRAAEPRRCAPLVRRGGGVAGRPVEAAFRPSGAQRWWVHGGWGFENGEARRLRASFFIEDYFLKCSTQVFIILFFYFLT